MDGRGHRNRSHDGHTYTTKDKASEAGMEEVAVRSASTALSELSIWMISCPLDVHMGGASNQVKAKRWANPGLVSNTHLSMKTR